MGRRALREGQAVAPSGPIRGFFPVNLEHPDQLAEMIAELTAQRREIGNDVTEPYDVVAALPPNTDPAPYESAGATWWTVEFAWDEVSVEQVRSVIRDGPAPAVA
jgi:hypothetical protein